MVCGYFLQHKMGFKADWDSAAARGDCEGFLNDLCSRLAEEGCEITIVRTKEDGSKIMLDLRKGFVTTVFDVPI